MGLDEFLPVYDVRERHERRVAGNPHAALAAALAVQVAPDGLVRTLFRLRGLKGRGTIRDALLRTGFAQLECTDTAIVLGVAGRPWSPKGRLVPFASAGPGQVRMAVSIEATAADGGSRLVTETRVQAMDARSRRAFRCYWFAVGPFSGFIRRRWLAAAERSLR
ncbi:MAG TPA: hypothetical protein VLE97_07840 [Gaiellaceae bacterium]|nr:hypothetical protein [Gaiellaceae bacterium]